MVRLIVSRFLIDSWFERTPLWQLPISIYRLAGVFGHQWSFGMTPSMMPYRWRTGLRHACMCVCRCLGRCWFDICAEWLCQCHGVLGQHRRILKSPPPQEDESTGKGGLRLVNDVYDGTLTDCCSKSPTLCSSIYQKHTSCRQLQGRLGSVGVGSGH